MPELRVLELFHGIGGMHAGLQYAEESLGGGVHVEVIKAFDISSVCVETYNLNYGPGIACAKDVKGLSNESLSDLDAHVWVMSPPCQPYTCRGKDLDEADPRAEGLSRLVRFLETSSTAALPVGVLLENVPGFETSKSVARLQSVLDARGYIRRQYSLCPTQFGVPNRRRRYYLLALLSSAAKVEELASTLDTRLEPGRSSTIPSVRPSQNQQELYRFLDGSPQDNYFQSDYLLPPHYRRYEAALDVVKPHDLESNCFTGSYGRYAKGSGSVLDCASHGLRLFSAKEITRLHCFPSSFEYPSWLPEKNRYQLIGNSVNVRVVGELCRILLPAAAMASQEYRMP